MTTACQIAPPFELDFTDDQLDDLDRRLSHARWPPTPDGANARHGLALDVVQELAEQWRSDFDWRERERALNELPHFVATVDGQPIHFLHRRSSRPDATPLMLIHGWPGSFVEFLDVIEPLTDADSDPAFHLVVPTLPGFLFSAPLLEEGWTIRRIAEALGRLMTGLGYERFGVQGGDWGAVIAADMARLLPERIAGVHVNAATAGFVPSGPVTDRPLTAGERARLSRLADFRAEASAFFHLQATRPQTLAYGLNDSPVGLLAWIAEKFLEWSHDPAGIDRERLLMNVALYWLTGTAGSAARIYAEFRRSPPDLSRSEVPTGVAVFAEDFAIRSVAEEHNTIARWSEFDRGGHFAALEEPELLVGDIRAFFAERSTR